MVRPFRGPIARNITLPGEVKAYQQATLYAKVAGYLKTIPVDKGDPVKEGALLAEIEVPELLADRARYQAELEVARSDYQHLSDSQKKAPDLVVPQTTDNARARLDIAKANLDRTETLLSFAKIVAPFSGVITKRMVDPGAFIPAATSGSTPQSAAIVTLADFNRVRVQVAVPELEAARLQAYPRTTRKEAVQPPARDIGHMGDAAKRHQVVRAHAMNRNAAHHNHVLALIRETFTQSLGRVHAVAAQQTAGYAYVLQYHAPLPV